MTLSNGIILAQFNKLSVPESKDEKRASLSELVTVISNIKYFGFIPSMEIFNVLQTYSLEELVEWEKETTKILSHITAEDRKMGDYAVYQNFPQEVYALSDAEQFINQIFGYFGVPYDLFREEKKEREQVDVSELKDLKVLSLAKENELELIYNNLEVSKTKWTIAEEVVAEILFDRYSNALIFDNFKFKMNAIFLAKTARKSNKEIVITNATDVLRLINEERKEYQSKDKYKFKRSERKFYLSLLNGCKNLEQDVAMRKEEWKKLLRFLHPSDFNFANVTKVYDKIYNNKLFSFEGKLKKAMFNKDISLLNGVPVGVILRNFHVLYNVFNTKPFTKELFEKCTIEQLVKLEKYIETINTRSLFIYRPKSSWEKAQYCQKTKSFILNEDKDVLLKQIHIVMNEKLEALYPNGIYLDKRIKDIMIPSNDLTLDLYGRGTIFNIPKDITVLRTGSYWTSTEGVVFYDNGVNFFDNDMKALGAICYDSRFKGAYFSGDPVCNQTDGKATQFIDLNIEQLKKNNVRYCFWNILSYNSIRFKDSDDVVATLQMLTDSEKGELYEPSKAENVFKIQQNSLFEYLLLIDLYERKVYFVDASISSLINSANLNNKSLEIKLPFIMEHLQNQASVYDLFKHGNIVEKYNEKDIDNQPLFVLYDDKEVTMNENQCPDAFIFKHLNTNNKFNEISLKTLLSK